MSAGARRCCGGGVLILALITITFGLYMAGRGHDPAQFLKQDGAGSALAAAKGKMESVDPNAVPISVGSMGLPFT